MCIRDSHSTPVQATIGSCMGLQSYFLYSKEPFFGHVIRVLGTLFPNSTISVSKLSHRRATSRPPFSSKLLIFFLFIFLWQPNRPFRSQRLQGRRCRSFLSRLPSQWVAKTKAFCSFIYFFYLFHFFPPLYIFSSTVRELRLILIARRFVNVV